MDIEKIEIETLPNGAVRRAGFKMQPRLDFIFMVDYGQPNKSEGGLILGDSSKEFWRYRYGEHRFGEVIAIGPGRPSLKRKSRGKMIPRPHMSIGDIVMFSRKVGSRLPKVDYAFTSAHHPGAGDLNIRVIDPLQAIAVHEGEFDPWWDLADAQLNPAGTMTG